MSLEILVYSVGDVAAAKLCAALGGADLRVPVDRAGETYCRLVEIMGAESAAQFVAHVGGDTLYIPRCTADRDKRNREICQLLEQGVSVTQIARSYVYLARLSERQVYRILAGLDRADPPPG